MVLMCTPNSETMAIRPALLYINMLYTQREKTGDIITFKNFKEGGLVSVNDNGMVIGEDPDEDSTHPPLIIGD